MYIVTNKIKTKKGFAERMAPNFTRPSALQKFPGFIKVETTITQNLEEYDELNVNMYWETLEAFHAWKESDIFKEAHKRPESSDKPAGESPLLGSRIEIVKVAGLSEAIKE